MIACGMQSLASEGASRTALCSIAYKMKLIASSAVLLCPLSICPSHRSLETVSDSHATRELPWCQAYHLSQARMSQAPSEPPLTLCSHIHRQKVVHHAFQLSPRAKCFRLLHIGRLCCRGGHCGQRAAEPSDPGSKLGTQERAGREGEASLLQHEEGGVCACEI